MATTRPDPAKCRELLEIFRDSDILVDIDLYEAKLSHENRGALIAALRFCAREPDGYVLKYRNGTRTTFARYSETLIPAPGDELFTCYRIEEPDER